MHLRQPQRSKLHAIYLNMDKLIETEVLCPVSIVVYRQMNLGFIHID